MKDTIKAATIDLVSSFLYYDRQECEDLPVGAIEKAIEDGEITKDEIITIFSDTLTEGLKVN